MFEMVLFYFLTQMKGERNGNTKHWLHRKLQNRKKEQELNGAQPIDSLQKERENLLLEGNVDTG